MDTAHVSPPSPPVHDRIIVAGTLDRLHDGHYALLHLAFARGRHVEVWVRGQRRGAAGARACAGLLGAWAGLRAAALFTACPRPPNPPPPPAPRPLQVMDDAAGAAKAARVGQPIQPFAARCAGVAAWCDAQTPAAIAEFGGRHGLALPPSPPAGGGGGDPAHPYRGRFSLHALADAFGPSVTERGYAAIVCSEESAGGCAAINAARAGAGLPPLEVVVAPLLVGAGGGKLSSTALRAADAAGGAAGAGAGGAGGKVSGL